MCRLTRAHVVFSIDVKEFNIVVPSHQLSNLTYVVYGKILVIDPTRHSLSKMKRIDLNSEAFDLSSKAS